MRTGIIEIGKKEYILCFSAKVVRECAERYGSFDQIGKVLMEGAEAEIMDESIWLLEQMMAAGNRYAEREGIQNPKPLTYDEIYDLCGLDDMMNLRTKVFETIANGSERKIEVEETGKNGGAAQSDVMRLSGISGMA